VTRAFNPSLSAFVGSYDGSDLDAALLQMAALRFCPPADPKASHTIEAIWKELAVDGWLLRYRLDDGFRPPTVAFTICTFWLIEALSLIGRREEARRVMDRVIPALSRVGLLAEDYEVGTLRMWGNFPQAYSHVGLIHAAFAASPSWQEVV
jgi:GH15 family glucan-1,4-alpha-glucosidase